MLYTCHTNLDNVKNGVNFHIAKLLDLQNVRILSPKKSELLKLETFAPKEYLPEILISLKNAGAGSIGEYSGCSFSSNGTGRFTGSENSNPTIGKPSTKLLLKK